jgi:hypothetical protein
MPVTLLDPLPPDEGECHSATVPGEPFVGWRQIRLVIGDGATGLRVIVGMYDQTGRSGMVSDLVATAGGARQESLGARIEPDGSMRGTYWLSEGDRHTPRSLTEVELSALRVLADALWQRCTEESGAQGAS